MIVLQSLKGNRKEECDGTDHTLIIPKDKTGINLEHLTFVKSLRSRTKKLSMSNNNKKKKIFIYIYVKVI